MTLTLNKEQLKKLFQPGVIFRRGEPIIKVDGTSPTITDIVWDKDNQQLIIEFEEQTDND